MATVAEHIKALYDELAQVKKDIIAITVWVESLAQDPLQQEIELDLPHASAGSAAPAAAAGGQATVETTAAEDGSLTVSLPAVSPETREDRLKFARDVMSLDEAFPEVADSGMTAAEAYSKGGPMWLYLGSKEGRDFILSAPVDWKRAMYEDIHTHHTATEAHEFARDVLKDTTATGTKDITYDYLLSTVS